MKRNATWAVLALAVSIPALAHEFWLTAQPFTTAVRAPIAITLQVGEYFTGERVGVTASHAASVRVYSAGGVENLDDRVPKDSMLPGLNLSFPRAGTYVVAYESHPSQVVLAADKFHAYT